MPSIIFMFGMRLTGCFVVSIQLQYRGNAPNRSDPSEGTLTKAGVPYITLLFGPKSPQLKLLPHPDFIEELKVIWIPFQAFTLQQATRFAKMQAIIESTFGRLACLYLLRNLKCIDKTNMFKIQIRTIYMVNIIVHKLND